MLINKLEVYEMKHYITHLIKDVLPKRGYKKLLFCTTNTDLMKKGLYLFGTGIRTFNSESIQNKVNQGELIELPKVEELKDGYGLWVDSEGYVYYGLLKNPTKGEMRKIFQPNGMTKTVQIFKTKFSHLKNTSVKKYVQLNP